MTVGTTPPRVEYVEDGVTTLHNIPFQFFDPDEIVVTRIDGTADANNHLLTLNVDYTVAGGEGEVGSITKATGGIDGATLKIQRHTHRSQLADYQPGDDFPAEQHEEALDRLEMQIQELEDQQVTFESVRDMLAKTLVAGPGIAIDVNDALNTITISALEALDFPDCVMLSGDQQAWEGVGDPAGAGGLSSEDVEDIIASMIAAGPGISVAYDDEANTFTITNTTEGGGGAIDAEAIQDIVGAMLKAGEGISVAYDDGTNTFTITNSAGAGGGGGGGAALEVVDESLIENGGFEELSNGLKLMWGKVNIPANGTPTIFFPAGVALTTFANVVGSGGHNGVSNPNNIRVTSVGLASFTVCNNDPTAADFWWQAIGK